MPGFLLHAGASVMCPHGGQVTIIPSSPRVLVSGQPVATAADTALVAACAFAPGGKPQPCVKVQWLVPAARVKVNGQPVLLHTSQGLCQSAEQAPQGPPNVINTQIRVQGM